LPQSINDLLHLTNKLAQLVEGIHGELSGVSMINVKRLRMWDNYKMKFEAFIHNDEEKCFHMVVQGTQKVVVMGHINLED
jgi:hypothetical protein